MTWSRALPGDCSGATTNLFIHGGRSDDRGYSIPDTLLRQDELAVARGTPEVVAGGAVLAGMAVIGGPAVQAIATRCRRARIKEASKFIVAHLCDESTKTLAGGPGSPYFQHGPELYDFIMEQVIVPVLEGDLQEMNIEWYLTEISSDVGVQENTVNDSLKLLRLRNSERPPAEQFGDEQIAVKILNMIKNASKTFAETANDEINAVEGV